MRSSRSAALSMVVVAGLAASASAQSLINGNVDGDAHGWAASANFGGYNSAAGSDGAPGFFWINSNGQADVPFVQQNITGLTPGGVYEVNGFYCTLAIFVPGDPIRVLIDGDLKYSDNNRRDTWTPFSFQFTASNTEAMLRFEAEVTSDSDWAIDTISVKSVPTPGAMGLLGVAGLAGMRRRR